MAALAHGTPCGARGSHCAPRRLSAKRAAAARANVPRAPARWVAVKATEDGPSPPAAGSSRRLFSVGLFAPLGAAYDAVGVVRVGVAGRAPPPLAGAPVVPARGFEPRAVFDSHRDGGARHAGPVVYVRGSNARRAVRAASIADKVDRRIKRKRAVSKRRRRRAIAVATRPRSSLFLSCPRPRNCCTARCGPSCRITPPLWRT